MIQKSDDEIIAAVIEGDRELYSLLVEKYQQKIFNYLNRFTRNAEKSRSLLQETFVKVYFNLHRYRVNTNFQAFLYRVAHNLTINALKKESREIFFQEIRENFFAHGSRQHTPEEKIAQREREDLLKKALLKLPRDQAFALSMKVFEGFSYSDIAGMRGWSLSKVESLIFRAKKNLKKQLQEKGVLNV